MELGKDGAACKRLAASMMAASMWYNAPMRAFVSGFPNLAWSQDGPFTRRLPSCYVITVGMKMDMIRK